MSRLFPPRAKSSAPTAFSTSESAQLLPGAVPWFDPSHSAK